MMHMGHDIVPKLAFVLSHSLWIKFILIGFHLSNLGVRNGQTEILLSLSQCNPQPAPGLKLVRI